MAKCVKVRESDRCQQPPNIVALSLDQELFPVFVLNLECPPKEVDVMVEADKTWVEFSDWAAAKNACVAMLLAFLPHFPHAVPSSVLRDLRRAFHNNEGDEAWRMASPPPIARRNTAGPTPSPSPSPMRLGMPPDVGTCSDVGVGSPPDSCAWMGRDRDSGTIGKEEKETIAKVLHDSRPEFRTCFTAGLVCLIIASTWGAPCTAICILMIVVLPCSVTR